MTSAANPPASILQREREPPRDPDQILGFEPFGRSRPDLHGACSILAIRSSVAPVARSVRIADVEPNGAVRAKHTPKFIKGADEAFDVRAQAVVAANLVGHLVVPQRPVRRRGNDGLDGFRGQQAKRSPSVPADQQGIDDCGNARSGVREPTIGARRNQVLLANRSCCGLSPSDGEAGAWLSRGGWSATVVGMGSLILAGSVMYWWRQGKFRGDRGSVRTKSAEREADAHRPAVPRQGPYLLQCPSALQLMYRNQPPMIPNPNP